MYRLPSPSLNSWRCEWSHRARATSMASASSASVCFGEVIITRPGGRSSSRPRPETSARATRRLAFEPRSSSAAIVHERNPSTVAGQSALQRTSAVVSGDDGSAVRDCRMDCRTADGSSQIWLNHAPLQDAVKRLPKPRAQVRFLPGATGPSGRSRSTRSSKPRRTQRSPVSHGTLSRSRAGAETTLSVGKVLLEIGSRNGA
jgi:hypothetical protein